MGGDVVTIGAVTGTQHGMTVPQLRLFRRVVWLWDVTELHHGDCVGADEEAAFLARLVMDARIVGHPPTDPRKRAYFDSDESRTLAPYLDRNRSLVDETQVLIACPDGPERLRSGTWSTIRYARKIGRRVIVIAPSGSVIVNPKEIDNGNDYTS